MHPRHTTITTLILASGVLMGCYTKVNLTLTNPSPVAISARVENTNEKDEPQLSTTIFIPGAAPAGTNKEISPGQQVVNWDKVKRLSKIKISYSPKDSSSYVPLGQPLIVHNSSQPYVNNLSIPKVEIYNPAVGEQTISKIGLELIPNGSTPVQIRLVDAIPLMGSVIVSTFSKGADGRETAEFHGNVILKPVKLEYSTPISSEGSTYVKQDLLTKTNISLPVYGSIAGAMSGNQLYNMSWNIKHYPYLNSTFNLGAALNAASITDLESILTLLDAQPEATLATVSELRVIESAVFSLTEGRTTSASGNAALASVFTGETAYEFSQTDKKLYSIPSMIIDIKYQKQKSRESAITLIQQLLTLKKKAVEKSPITPPTNKIKQLFRDLDNQKENVKLTNESSIDLSKRLIIKPSGVK